MAKAAKRDTSGDAARITEILAAVDDWRGATLRRLRDLIKEVDPDVVEELKWKKPSNPDGVPTWNHDGIVCTGEWYKGKVKLNFPKGASLDDPKGLFNANLESKTGRALDIFEDDELDAAAFKALIRQAVAANVEAVTAKRKR